MVIETPFNIRGEPMIIIELDRKERKLLEQLIRETDNATQLRRAQSILWFDDGISVEDIAELLYVSRLTVYKWVRQFQERTGLEIEERVSDGIRSGRPRTVSGIIDRIIDKVIDKDPRKFGYSSTVWTASLLKEHIEKKHSITVSEKSVRLAIERLGIGWKRPRHQLALQPETWRQAKGGLKRG